MLDYSVVHLVAADADRFRVDDVGERHDSHLRRAAADIDYHVPCGFLYRKAYTDRSGYRLLDQIYLAGACPLGRIFDCALLYFGYAGRYSDDHAGSDQNSPIMDLINKITEHRLRYLEISDHSVFHRPYGHYGTGGTA